MPPVVGKVAVVTGASSGIGKAIVKELVAAGMKVAGLARRVDRVQALAKSLKSQKGSLSAIKCDVTREDEVKTAFKWVEQNLGPPTAVINNAGILKMGLISELSLDQIKLMFDTNVIGLTCCAKEALNTMVKNKTEGTIVNINSVAGHDVLPFAGAHGYSSTKFAVTALSAGLRNEVTQLGANIRVTSLSPGSIVSEITEQFKDANKQEKSTPRFDLLPASDVADCVLFVLQSPQRMTISELTVLPTNETALSRAIVTANMLTE